MLEKSFNLIYHHDDLWSKIQRSLHHATAWMISIFIFFVRFFNNESRVSFGRSTKLKVRSRPDGYFSLGHMDIIESVRPGEIRNFMNIFKANRRSKSWSEAPPRNDAVSLTWGIHFIKNPYNFFFSTIIV